MTDQTRLLDPHGRPIPRAQVLRARLAASTAFAAASTDAQEFKNFDPPASSADADLFGERGRVMARARDVERNDALAHGAVQSHKDRVIGNGLRLQARPDAEILGLDRADAQAMARRIEAIWAEWAEDARACDVTGHNDFGALTRQACHSDMVNGESVAILRWLPRRQGRRGSRFATTLQVIEPDRLSNPHDVADTDRLRAGIEIDEFGAPIAYHIRTTHPGDLFTTFGLGGRWDRVPAMAPAGRPRVIHNFDQRRPGQHRGISLFAPVLAALKMLARYTRAELQGAVVNAVIAAVLETPLDGQTLAELFGSGKDYLDARKDASQPVKLGVGPGGFIPRTFPGERLSSYNTGRPSDAFEPFVTAVQRHIAVGLGQTYETLVRDFSKTNFSSARASLLEAWRFVLFHRVFKAATWCKPVYAAVIQEAVARGYLDLPGFLDDPQARRAWLRSSWLGPGRGWVDPVKEAQAAAMRVAGLMSTLRDEAVENGKDPDELLEQIATERDRLAELGLTVPPVQFGPGGPADEPVNN